MMKIKAVKTNKYITNPIKGTLYVNFKLGKMFLECPNSKCKETVVLPMKSGSETWTISSSGYFKWKKILEPVDVHPSVFSTNHIDRCHYWIRNGIIEWTK